MSTGNFNRFSSGNQVLRTQCGSAVLSSIRDSADEYSTAAIRSTSNQAPLGSCEYADARLSGYALAVSTENLRCDKLDCAMNQKTIIRLILGVLVCRRWALGK